MKNILLILCGLCAGIFLMMGTILVTQKKSQPIVGATSPYAGHIGVFNNPPITLRTGEGSALATDVNGRIIATSTPL